MIKESHLIHYSHTDFGCTDLPSTSEDLPPLHDVEVTLQLGGHRSLVWKFIPETKVKLFDEIGIQLVGLATQKDNR
jgi:hypothetical protein